MKATPECMLCLFRQALNTARAVTSDESLQQRILTRVAAYAAQATLDQSPAQLSQPAYRIVAELTGNPDPYLAHKQAANRTALEVLPAVRQKVAAASDALLEALRAAAAGNVIDLGIAHEFDITKDILALMSQPLAISALESFRQELGPGRRLLYLGDNAGEIVFDTLLVEQILKTGTAVTYSVKSGPIINDATLVDAEAVGMLSLVPVIETGGADIGVNWANISEEFRQAVERADVILAKGHGNFETCDDQPGNFYFLLKAKCALVAQELGCRLGDLVLARPSAALRASQ